MAMVRGVVVLGEVLIGNGYLVDVWPGVWHG
jgi:hypothetical protein